MDHEKRGCLLHFDLECTTYILNYDFEMMDEAGKEQALLYLAGLTSIVFSAEQLSSCSLAKKA